MPARIEPVALAPWTVVRQVITTWFQRSFGPSHAQFAFDLADANPARNYSLIEPDAVSAMLECDPRLERELYEEGRYDCEDFAVAARSAVTFACATNAKDRNPLPVAFGLLFTGVHALNIGIAPDRKPYLYDHYYNRVWKEETLDNALQDLTELGTGWLKTVRYVLI
jgi:hypothetical protein